MYGSLCSLVCPFSLWWVPVLCFVDNTHISTRQHSHLIKVNSVTSSGLSIVSAFTSLLANKHYRLQCVSTLIGHTECRFYLGNIYEYSLICNFIFYIHYNLPKNRVVFDIKSLVNCQAKQQALKHLPVDLACHGSRCVQKYLILSRQKEVIWSRKHLLKIVVMLC